MLISAFIGNSNELKLIIYTKYMAQKNRNVHIAINLEKTYILHINEHVSCLTNKHFFLTRYSFKKKKKRYVNCIKIIFLTKKILLVIFFVATRLNKLSTMHVHALERTFGELQVMKK